MQVTCEYTDESLDVRFVADAERSDYGVPGSPQWDEVIPHTIEIERLSICGVDVDPKELPDRVRDAIRGIAEECDFH